MKTEHFYLEEILQEAKIIREERKEKHGDTWKLMSGESIKDFAKSKIERYYYSQNHDDLIDILVYLEFLYRKIKKN